MRKMEQENDQIKEQDVQESEGSKVTEQEVKPPVMEVVKEKKIGDIITSTQQRIQELHGMKTNIQSRLEGLRTELKNAEITVHVIDGIINELNASIQKWQ